MKKILIAALAFFLSVAPALAEEVSGLVTALSDKEITVQDEAGKTHSYKIAAGSHVHHMCEVGDKVNLTVANGEASKVQKEGDTEEGMDEEEGAEDEE